LTLDELRLSSTVLREGLWPMNDYARAHDDGAVARRLTLTWDSHLTNHCVL
jgi:hypothetical protein